MLHAKDKSPVKYERVCIRDGKPIRVTAMVGQRPTEEQLAKLFERYINRWSRMQTARDARDRAFEDERTVGDRNYGGR